MSDNKKEEFEARKQRWQPVAAIKIIKKAKVNADEKQKM